MMRRYPAYRDSGVDWLGEVPEGWGVVAIKRIAFLQSGNTITAERIEETGDYPVFGGNGLRGFTDQFTHEGEYALIGRQGALCGNINYATGRFWASEHAIVVHQKFPFVTRWLGEVLRTMNLGQYSTSAAQPGVAVEVINELRIPLPPLSEQTAIAAFLDRETGKIDALVAEQRRLIDLLREKRQATISHAVTRGLSPAAPLKPSGVDWLGDVPEGWEVVRLRNVATLNPSKTEVAHWAGDTEVSFLPMEAVGENGELDLERTRPLSEVLNGYTYFVEGDVTYAKITPCFENGKGALMRGLLNGFGFGTTELTVLRPNPARILPEFLDCVLASPNFRRIGEGAMYGAGGQKRVPDDFARDFVICLPSLDEQGEIVAAITKAKDQFDSLITTAESAISLLLERRAALISAAVTGKIDVREPEAA